MKTTPERVFFFSLPVLIRGILAAMCVDSCTMSHNTCSIALLGLRSFEPLGVFKGDDLIDEAQTQNYCSTV